MSDYSKQNTWAGKDELTTGDPNKVISATDLDEEFSALVTAIASKADHTSDTITSPTLAGTVSVTGTFTSRGIDDNATTTVLTLTDNTASVAGVVSSFGGILVTGTGYGILSTGQIHSKGITDNASAAAITIDSSQNVAIDTNTLFVDSVNNNVGIGTSSPAYPLTVKRATGAKTDLLTLENDVDPGLVFIDSGNWSSRIFVEGATNSLVFENQTDTERMRIDSSGYLNVGTSLGLGIPSTTTEDGFAVGANGQLMCSTSSSTPGLQINNYNYTSGIGQLVWFKKAGGASPLGSITHNGSAIAYNTTSDVRLKENIVDAPAGNIDSLRVRSFDWKDSGSHQDYGFIAQELEEAAPYAVTKGMTDDDMWSVDYSKLVPLLVKEIQELKAEIAALKGV